MVAHAGQRLADGAYFFAPFFFDVLRIAFSAWLDRPRLPPARAGRNCRVTAQCDTAVVWRSLQEPHVLDCMVPLGDRFRHRCGGTPMPSLGPPSAAMAFPGLSLSMSDFDVSSSFAGPIRVVRSANPRSICSLRAVRPGKFKRKWSAAPDRRALVAIKSRATYFLSRGTLPMRKNSALGCMPLKLAMRLLNPKKAVMAAMSQMSSSSKP